MFCTGPAKRRLLLNEVEAEEEFFSSTEIELTCKCDDKIRKASSKEKTLFYAVFKCVDDLSVLINVCYDAPVDC